jgi:hypothetical protein
MTKCYLNSISDGLRMRDRYLEPNEGGKETYVVHRSI